VVCGGSLRKVSVIRYQVFEFPNFYVWVNVEVSLKIKDYMKELGLSILRVKRVMSNHAESSLDLILEGSSRMVNNRGGGVERGQELEDGPVAGMVTTMWKTKGDSRVR
jgi:hypothetical protein